MIDFYVYITKHFSLHIIDYNYIPAIHGVDDLRPDAEFIEEPLHPSASLRAPQ